MQLKRVFTVLILAAAFLVLLPLSALGFRAGRYCAGDRDAGAESTGESRSGR